jgi:hypothetical protein
MFSKDTAFTLELFLLLLFLLFSRKSKKIFFCRKVTCTFYMDVYQPGQRGKIDPVLYLFSAGDSGWVRVRLLITRVLSITCCKGFVVIAIDYRLALKTVNRSMPCIIIPLLVRLI